MGIVRSYEDRQLGRSIALKALADGDGSDSVEFAAKFVDEARVQAQLEHPSVVPVYELGVDPDGRFYFTMKRVQGVTLREVFERLHEEDPLAVRAWSRRRLLEAFGRVCLAVQYAHERGFLHRDLKPSNVMLGDYGEVYVLDWGIALRLERAREGSLRPGVGSRGYMAPEQRAGDPLGPATDVYALGVLLRDLLDATAPSEVIPELEAMHKRATDPEAGGRYATARMLYDALERFLDGERDQERRVALADEHAAKANEAATQAARDDGQTDAAIESRREAIQEIGRALGLVPGHPEAMGTLVRLLSRLPERLPAEAEDSLERRWDATRAWAGRVSAVAYASLLIYWPLFLWAGVRDVVPLLVLSGLAVASTAAAALVSRSPRPKATTVFPVMGLSMLLMASTATMFGPLVITPAVMATNTAAYALVLRGNHRWLAVAGGCAALLVPVLLMAGGVWPDVYAFGPQGMTIRPWAIDLSGRGAFVLLVISALAAIVTATISVAKIRNELDQAQRKLELYSWHFRQLLPD
jgi:serine/threonine-protein kinase